MAVSSVVVPEPPSSPVACRSPYRRSPNGARDVLGGLGLDDPPVRCWSWRCSGCAYLKAKDARELARRGIALALEHGQPLVMLTLTEPAISRSFEQSSAALTKLMKRLQTRSGSRLRWIAVAEWQARGAVHWHVVVSGLVYTAPWSSPHGRLYPGHPQDHAGYRVRKEADLRPLVERYGFGRMFNIHAVGVRPEDTAKEVASYLAKYLTKEQDLARLPKGAQPVRSSRGKTQWAFGCTLTSLRDERRAQARERFAGEAA